jgi:ATP-binding cassette, subfamily B (MDR/TAP), member 1
MVAALLLSNIAEMRARANFLSIWWLVIGVIEFGAYFLQGWGFGYSSEKMVCRSDLIFPEHWLIW